MTLRERFEPNRAPNFDYNGSGYLGIELKYGW
jgi:hypothetical protein